MRYKLELYHGFTVDIEVVPSEGDDVLHRVRPEEVHHQPQDGTNIKPYPLRSRGTAGLD